jgi:hypothetical protein
MLIVRMQKQYWLPVTNLEKGTYRVTAKEVVRKAAYLGLRNARMLRDFAQHIRSLQSNTWYNIVKIIWYYNKQLI